MIPEDINVLSVLTELQALGWKDYKIEMACGFNRGYVAQIRCGNVKAPAYHYTAKLLNFLEQARQIRPHSAGNGAPAGAQPQRNLGGRTRNYAR